MKIIRQGRSKFVIRAKFIVGHARQTARQTDVLLGCQMSPRMWKLLCMSDKCYSIYIHILYLNTIA